jgi:hypothetical protein
MPQDTWQRDQTLPSQHAVANVAAEHTNACCHWQHCAGHGQLLAFGEAARAKQLLCVQLHLPMGGHPSYRRPISDVAALPAVEACHKEASSAPATSCPA